MPHLLSKDRIVAEPGFNRWLVPPASVAIHMCIGSVYAWSIFNPPLTKVLGVAASSADDWTLGQVVWIFTVAIVFLGLAAAFAGRWLETVGPRMVGTVSALCWGGGFIVGGLGILWHQLWLLYLGYGVLGGCGLGLGYVSPVGTLIRWFPDRRGMATGLAIMGFGGGAMIAAPLNEYLIRTFHEPATYLGTLEEVDPVTEDGRQYATVDGERVEVVVVAGGEVRQMIEEGEPGVYVVGTGESGVAATFFTLGGVYMVIMLIAAFSYRIPPPGWTPVGWTPPDPTASARRMITTRDVDIDRALRVPQFYILWLLLCLNVTAGIGVLGVAKTMMSEIFGTTLPHVVDATFAGTYVIMISVFNMVGRFFWASSSDYVGRKRTYAIFFGFGTLLYASIPYCAQAVSASPAVVWLVYFYAATMLIFTMYGGGFATIPAYIADLFGTRYVGGIHGRILTAWSTAGVLGPVAITSLRENARRDAIEDLAGKVEPTAFAERFGASLNELPALVESKTVTIAKLMEIVPAGTPDPSSTLYNSTMYLMAGLLAVAFIANLFVRPVQSKHHIAEERSG